jgi:hypothetical protein
MWNPVSCRNRLPPFAPTTSSHIAFSSDHAGCGFGFPHDLQPTWPKQVWEQPETKSDILNLVHRAAGLFCHEPLTQ